MNPVDVFAFLPHLGGAEELKNFFFLNLAMTFVGEKKANNYSKKMPRGLPRLTMWLTIVLI